MGSQPIVPFWAHRWTWPVAGGSGIVTPTGGGAPSVPGISRTATSSLTFTFFSVGFSVAFFRSLPFAILVLPLLGCPGSPGGSPRIVSAKTLVNDHIADRDAARLAYHNQTLQVRIDAYVVAGSEIHYLVFFDGKPRKPAIVFRFEKPPENAKGQTLWIEGHCDGCTDDQADRVLPVKFCITVSHCRLVPPPVPPGP